MAKTSRYISMSDNNLLFSRSAGQCNICKKNVPHLAERAHIIAHSENGARGDSLLQSINSYDNLILLCPTCHTEIDKFPERYPSEKLHQIKAEHEKSISDRLSSSNQQRQNDVYCIKALIEYGEICNIPNFIDLLPSSVDIRALDFYDVLRELEKRPDIYPLSDYELQGYLNNFIILSNKLWSWIGGSTPDISGNFSYQHFSQAEGQPLCIRRQYNGISADRNQEIDSQIEIAKQKFLESHYNLIIYIRNSYPEVVRGLM